MTKTKRVLLFGLLAIVVVIGYVAVTVGTEFSRMRSEDPAVWESEIRKLEGDGAVSDGTVLFVGSSSIRLWETIEEDMQPLIVARRGFGGAKVNDVLFYAERLITNQKPAAVVIYIGGNDVSDGRGNEPKEPEAVLTIYKQLIARIRSRLPDTPIYYLAIKPGGFPDEVSLERATTFNRLVQEFHANTDDLYYIDANASLVGEDGRVRSELKKYDRVHLNREGYAVWAPSIRDRLLSDSRNWAY